MSKGKQGLRLNVHGSEVILRFEKCGIWWNREKLGPFLGALANSAKGSRMHLQPWSVLHELGTYALMIRAT